MGVEASRHHRSSVLCQGANALRRIKCETEHIYGIVVSSLNNDYLQHQSRPRLDIIVISVLLEGEKKKEKERG